MRGRDVRSRVGELALWRLLFSRVFGVVGASAMVMLGVRVWEREMVCWLSKCHLLMALVMVSVWGRVEVEVPLRGHVLIFLGCLSLL